jgi:hypothetical protein
MNHKFKPGDSVIINSCSDLTMIADAKPFIGKECIVIKYTKAGLVQVYLADGNPNLTMSFAQIM